MKPEHSNTYIIWILLTFGRLCNSVAVKQNANEKVPGLKHITLDTSSNAQNSDYDDAYIDDEEGPGEQIKDSSANLKATLMPYFDEKTEMMDVNVGERVVLKCMPKNYNEEKNQIVWFKEDHPITNGLAIVSKIGAEVDKNFNLIIRNFTKDDVGNYDCTIMPQNVRRHIEVKISDKTLVANQTNETSTEKSYQPTLLPTSIITLTVIIMLQKLIAF